MKRRTVRTAKRAALRAARAKAQKNPGGNSNYARKHDFLAKHKLWGWEVPEPKPWRTKA